ncbi:ShlB/FhaC/HecB family hemolysin secretion/activation protein [Octadecabacter sp. G9-8]|uniref:ShlB/FhaC/HecB family hemolysin secretion/activation protein n=1 Tax=Octadecabacter dasysiphoniae TaxID=2909341 RepID=A0ABS9D0L2_9RHOB|nr:ShlB/FhaC/HecB family hemolysin secretion/activation protein [Octadecabacter dasysiphoniae]MCF2872968.1 ShlB/FhaC/HecB family hemolysin secretion/activation protein [Octadecabacter dasysiphoniae]
MRINKRRLRDPFFAQGFRYRFVKLRMRRMLGAIGVAGAFALPADTARAQGFCLDVDRIDLVGVTLIDVPAQQALTAPFAGRCLGLPQIDDLLQAVSLAYVDRGYITARAYLPEQNLADGQLEIRVIEGSLARIDINGEPRPRWQERVFPDLVGAPVNLREVEQGLDLIRSMPGYSAEIELTPGTQEGATVLDVTAVTAKPWSFRLSTNNQGLENEDPGQTVATGQFITSAQMTWSNALGLNDVWTLDASKSIRDNPIDVNYDGPGTRSVDLSLSIPRGPWRTEYGIGWSDYATVTPGAVGDIDVDGVTRTAFVEVERLLERDRDSKTYVTARLTRYDTENRIAGARIEASSQVTTSARFGVRHETLWNGGQLTLSAGLEQGLDALGAQDDDTQPTGQPEAQYTLVDGSLSYTRPFAGDASAFSWQSDVNMQLSADRLYGRQQFGLGSAGTVRGAREQVVAGSSGILWRNELRWTPQMERDPIWGQAQLYGGIDWGWVADQSRVGVSGGHVSGAVIGARTIGGKTSFEVNYAEILSTPTGIARPDGVLSMSASWLF